MHKTLSFLYPNIKMWVDRTPAEDATLELRYAYRFVGDNTTIHHIATVTYVWDDDSFLDDDSRPWRMIRHLQGGDASVNDCESLELAHNAAHESLIQAVIDAYDSWLAEFHVSDEQAQKLKKASIEMNALWESINAENQ